MKKIIAIILTIVCVLTLSIAGVTSMKETHAKSAQMRIEVPDAVKKEKEFTVKVILESDVQLYSIDAYLQYDATLLEFVPDSAYVTGAEGVLELKDSYNQETKAATYEIRFKALDTGVTEIALTDVYLIDYEDLDYITVTPSAKQFEIGVNRMVAEDARLSELIVAPGTFTTEFDPNVLEYEMHVGLDVTTVGVSAIPMDETSTVALEMPDKLLEGKNVIRITVTALSVNVNEYVFYVIREEIEKSPDEESVDDISTEDEDVQSTEEEGNQPTEEETSETTDDEADEATKDETEDGTKEDAAESTTEETSTSESTTEEVTESTTEETTTESTTEREVLQPIAEEVTPEYE